MNGSGQNLQMRHDVCYPLPHERERAESADEASSLLPMGSMRPGNARLPRFLSYHDKGSAQLDHLLEPSKDWPESTMMIRQGEEVDRVLLHRLIRKYLSFGCLQKLCRFFKGFVHPH